jgi:hypothetical protein
MRPDNWKEQIGGHEAISFGAVGWPEKIADHVSLWDRCCCFAVGWTSAVFHACWYKYKRLIFGSGKAQTAAIPGGIARICNTARAEKTLFYVPDSVKHCTSTSTCVPRASCPA